jgi:hypothetical protein
LPKFRLYEFGFYLNGLVVALALSGLELAAGGRAKLSGMFRALSVGHKPEKNQTIEINNCTYMSLKNILSDWVCY